MFCVCVECVPVCALFQLVVNSSVLADVDASGPRKLPFGYLSVCYVSAEAYYAPWIALIECFMLLRAWGWAWGVLLPVV